MKQRQSKPDQKKEREQNSTLFESGGDEWQETKRQKRNPGLGDSKFAATIHIDGSYAGIIDF